MDTIIPRWEWRTFGDEFGAADAKLAVKPSAGRDAFPLEQMLAELGAPGRTVASESENAGRVLEAGREMGLAGFTNASYPRGLQAVIGMKG